MLKTGATRIVDLFFCVRTLTMDLMRGSLALKTHQYECVKRSGLVLVDGTCKN